MSEYKRANSFGTGYLDTDSCYKMKIENKTKKRFFEVAGDEKAMSAFSQIPNEPVVYRYDRERGMVGADGKDYFFIELTTPEGDKMSKTCSYNDYMSILKTYGIVTEGKWKEWGKSKSGGVIQVPVQE